MMRQADHRSDRSRVPTFGEATELAITNWKDTGSGSTRTERDWRGSFERYVLPTVGNMSVAQITLADLRAVLDPIWIETPRLARIVLARVRVVLDLAVDQGWIKDNPANDGIEESLHRPSEGVEHHHALSLHEVGASIAAVAASGASATTKLALRFLILTAARPGEVLSAERDDIDLESRVWTVPARLTKNGESRRIPLSSGAVAVLEEAYSRNPDSRYVFPSPRTGRPWMYRR